MSYQKQTLSNELSSAPLSSPPSLLHHLIPSLSLFFFSEGEVGWSHEGVHSTPVPLPPITAFLHSLVDEGSFPSLPAGTPAIVCFFCFFLLGLLSLLLFFLFSHILSQSSLIGTVLQYSAFV